jgi:hypothetical protein
MEIGERKELMETKLKMKTGTIEIEFEGTEAFLTEQLAALIGRLAPQINSAPIGLPRSPTPAQSDRVELTTGSVAAKLSAKSGPDLILAACAHLTFVETRDVFSRDDITEKMKTATAYFKATFLNNLTKYLQGLVKNGKLVERSAGTYSLSAAARGELEGKLREP